MTQVNNSETGSRDSETSDDNSDMSDTYILCDESVDDTNDLTGSEDCLDIDTSGEETVQSDLPNLTDIEPSSEPDFK